VNRVSEVHLQLVEVCRSAGDMLLPQSHERDGPAGLDVVGDFAKWVQDICRAICNWRKLHCCLYARLQLVRHRHSEQEVVAELAARVLLVHRWQDCCDWFSVGHSISDHLCVVWLAMLRLYFI